MIDITQTMACIQCGACVSDCLSMEVDPLFIGPAALAKAYRFVGDPRDGQHEERLRDLAEDPHGIYDCTHCFNCIEACPKGVAPMSQIMRLRRIAGADHGIDDRNNGHRHEMAFVKNIEQQRPAARGRPAARLLRRQVPPARGAGAAELAAGRSCARCSAARSRPAGALLHKHKASKEVKRIFRDVHDREERYELNLYVVGEEEEDEPNVKVAYWPGCVSRGFTPELHGSMAQVAPLLDIELVELDRASCCGAGVIAEHNQELADTLNARTFALAQQEIASGADADDEHLLDLPGRAERVPGAPGREHAVPRARQRDAVGRGPARTRRASPTSTSCGCWSRRSGSTRSRPRSSGR